MQTGLSDHVWTFDELATMMDAALPKPGLRGLYEKKAE
jgi:hypothetical protein